MTLVFLYTDMMGSSSYLALIIIYQASRRGLLPSFWEVGCIAWHSWVLQMEVLPWMVHVMFVVELWILSYSTKYVKYFVTIECMCFMSFSNFMGSMWRAFSACIDSSWIAPLMSTIMVIEGFDFPPHGYDLFGWMDYIFWILPWKSTLCIILAHLPCLPIVHWISNGSIFVFEPWICATQVSWSENIRTPSYTKYFFLDHIWL